MKNFVYKVILKILKRNISENDVDHPDYSISYGRPKRSIEELYIFPKIATKFLLYVSLYKIKNNGFQIEKEKSFDRNIIYDCEPKKRLYKLENNQKIILNF